jgi:hypothetical protein
MQWASVAKKQPGWPCVTLMNVAEPQFEVMRGEPVAVGAQRLKKLKVCLVLYLAQNRLA